ncbi:MAG: substrate-binding domain-containing protein [Lentisphaerae bacterium]|nr:substrate-binding domain-containing protein [Lentisphaerota bacterium]
MSARKGAEIVTTLADEIRRGKHGDAGSVFMTVRSLREQFGVSLVTAQRAVNKLKAQGLLVRSGKRLSVAYRHSDHAVVRRLGVLLTNMENPFFACLLNALEQAARRREVEIISAGSCYDLKHEKRQLGMLAAAGATGFLICPANDVASAAALAALARPFVLIGRQVAGIDADVVAVNDFEAGRLAAAHLVHQQCRHYFYLGTQYMHNDVRARGYAHGLRERGCALPAEHCLAADLTEAEDSLCSWLLKRHRGKRTGVFCYHDLLALRLLRAARICQLRVPEDLAIVGMDNLPVAAETYPSLTSVSYSLPQLAERALDVLLRRLDGQVMPLTVNQLDPTLVPRESSCCLAIQPGRAVNG